MFIYLYYIIHITNVGLGLRGNLHILHTPKLGMKDGSPCSMGLDEIAMSSFLFMSPWSPSEIGVTACKIEKIT